MSKNSNTQNPTTDKLSEKFESSDGDWGDILDDQESEYWEKEFGGLDDGTIEKESEKLFRRSFLTDSSEKSIDRTRERKKRIVEWLSKSRHSKKLRSTEGFYIRAKTLVRRQNGEKVDLLTWLINEGIRGDSDAHQDYTIIHTHPKSRRGERMVFIQNTDMNAVLVHFSGPTIPY